MSAELTPEPVAPDEVVLGERARRFIEEFALSWETWSSPRMEGRIVALLMIIDEPYLSSSQIASLLKASAGSVSTSTRRLVEVGFVRRHAIAGDRNHYFRVEDDIWGGFLASEQAYLARLGDAIETGFTSVDGEGEAPLRRLRNARNYMDWLSGYHTKMQADWAEYRDALAGQGTAGDRADDGGTGSHHQLELDPPRTSSA